MQYFITIKKPLTLLVLSFFLLFNSFCVFAEKEQVSLARINQNISVDGVLDEAHWKKATYVPLLVQDEPNERGTPPVKTDAYMYEDGTNLYVGFIAYDPEPDQIRASLRDRDTLWQDDTAILV